MEDQEVAGKTLNAISIANITGTEMKKGTLECQSNSGIE
jgi:hypothetical protein